MSPEREVSPSQMLESTTDYIVLNNQPDSLKV